MGVINEIIAFFYDGNPLSGPVIGMTILKILMIVSSALFIISFVSYLVKYRIFAAIWSKITKNAREYDRIRRKQMRAELENRSNPFSKRTKNKFVTRIYSVISRSGIVEKIPGFSELGFLITFGIITAFLFIIITYFRGIVVGVVAAVAFVVSGGYILSLIAYNRKVRLERQLLQFINACASASSQYANIIDIFGVIYDQFSNPLKEGLESCYVEAKQLNDKETALRHLKEKFDSVQFSFIIDNLELCSKSTGDYYSTARDISEMVSIYSSSYEKKRAQLRSTKITITMMFALGVGIVFALSKFLENLADTLLNTTIGNLSLILLAILYLYGMNLRTDK